MSAKSMRRAIVAMVEENSDEDEWFPLGDLGNLILKRYPDFDVRNFGFKKFTPFIKSLGAFEFKEERVPGSNNRLIYIREKQEKPAAAAAAAAAERESADRATADRASDRTVRTSQKPILEHRNWMRKKQEL